MALILSLLASSAILVANPFAAHAADGPKLAYRLAAAGYGNEPRVFAHYFPPYPLSMDNKPAASDYYTVNYLNPDGEGGKFRRYGGLLRDRPLPQAPLASSDWKQRNLLKEVNQAAEAGIDGFFVDVLSIESQNWDRVLGLTEAAAASPHEFVVAPQIDLKASVAAASTAAIADKLAILARMPGSYKTPSGEFVVSAFKAEDRSVKWWSEIIQRLESKHRIPTSFRPIVLNTSWMDEFAPISDAIGNWGTRSPGSTAASPDYAATARALGLRWIQPISVQDSRPRGRAYWEAGNLEQLRQSWARAINGRADYVVLNTWNDYSENSGFAPSVGHGWTFLDVSGYYATRFKTGKYPLLDRDAIYLTHRKHDYNARPRLTHELQDLMSGSRDPARNTVEVMTFLTKPATLTITAGSMVTTVQAGAGVNSYSVPLRVGQIKASAHRDGASVASTTTNVVVTSSPTVQDLQYVASSSLR